MSHQHGRLTYFSFRILTWAGKVPENVWSNNYEHLRSPIRPQHVWTSVQITGDGYSSSDSCRVIHCERGRSSADVAASGAEEAALINGGEEVENYNQIIGNAQK
ncbi:hypothetical protein F2P81_015377 [Scophthalmus maximus]|uniref:Uncharacterized protein n=1 Tax=Scophthalmus maximus TaxID=52904 RepID=A0A6A4SIL3_SCOMX|nr:hypothetical protein F2P81_015377 [Scophthalmus maximus]